MKIRVAVVDDEALGRRGITSRLAQRNDVIVVSECANGEEAIEALRREQPDLVFLDVQMPGMDGFEVIRRLGSEECPAVIFVTAWDRHAVRAFDVHALDYLLKPIDDARFHEAVDRAVAGREEKRMGDQGRRLAAILAESPGGGSGEPERYSVKLKGRTVFVPLGDIDWVEAEGDYVRIHAGKEAWLVRETMASIERDLGPVRFARIHRSTIVNIERIRELRTADSGDHAVCLRDGTSLRLGRSYREAVEKMLGSWSPPSRF